MMRDTIADGDIERFAQLSVVDTRGIGQLAERGSDGGLSRVALVGVDIEVGLEPIAGGKHDGSADRLVGEGDVAADLATHLGQALKRGERGSPMVGR